MSLISHATTNSHCLLSLVRSCKSTKQLKQTHAHFLKLHPSSVDLLLSSYSYSPFSNLTYANTLFSLLPTATIFHWNSIIRGFASSTSPTESLSLYRSMLRNTDTRPNNLTYPFLVKSCTLHSHCSMLHTHIVRTGFESDPYVQSSLIHTYVATGKDIDSARKVFDACSVKETVCWNSMIDGFVKCGKIGLASSVFDRMECRDIVSWNTMINGYSLLGDLDEACKVFDGMPQRNLVSWNSMLAGYNKCGDVEGARWIFNEMPRRDVVSWNTMLTCYAQSGCCDEAFVLFDEMQRVGVKPTDATVVSMLSVCAHLGALDRGYRLHRFIDDNSIELNTIVSTALVDMYARCGQISRAYQTFSAIEHKDVLAWNAIIAAMAVHGQANEALRLMREMMECGNRPDNLTFVAVLSACSHAGMLREGRELLSCMKGTYGVEPKVEHYGCVIDLLARKGMLEEAVSLMESMPVEPNASIWGAILGGCRIHCNSEVADSVGIRLLNLQPKHSGRYVLLSNIYASTNRWNDASTVRSMMSTKGITKIPGMSMIELKGILNHFVAGDQSHPESKNIHRKLLEVAERLKVEAGYNPDIKQVLTDIEEEEKEQTVLVHSEKLAISFGLLHTGFGDTVRIIKNLRVCRDCHHLMKLTSKVYCRVIVMRDRNRFHLFKDGACSCFDYW